MIVNILAAGTILASLAAPPSTRIDSARVHRPTAIGQDALRDVTVLYRVNCGGPSLPAADASAPDWAEDSSTTPSPYSNYAASGSTAGLTASPVTLGTLIPPEVPSELFQTERWDPFAASEMSWDFPVPAGEEVLVRLFFAENFPGVTGPGQRYFDVSIEGTLMIDDLDFYAEAGFNTAIMKWFIVTVGPDANLDIDFAHASANPTVMGIEILTGDHVLEAAMDSALPRAYLQLDIDPAGYPLNTDSVGQWYTTGPSNWTSGFFPGALWRCYATTGNTTWRIAAEPWTEGLEDQQYLTAHQDVGFMIFCSYGEGYRLTSRPDYRNVILTAANSLSQRYNATVGCIRASGNAPTGEYRVIIDGMMNLEILLWAARHGGQQAWHDMAVSHANHTIDDLIRPDGSTFQEVFYDIATGDVLRKGTFNGYSVDSTWSRGQAWGIYGFTMVYREAGGAQFLAAAQQLADYYIDHVPADYVPPWDFDAPGPDQEKDSSAAAITAAGLLELSTFVTDPVDQERYRTAGRNILKSLCTDAYLSNGVESEGTLLHGTYNKNYNQGVDASLIWGDYYLLVAIERALRFGDRGDCLTSLPTWRSGLFPAADGLLLVEFEASPNDDNMNGIIGLAEDAGTAPSDYAALVRFNDSGVIDARNGDHYEADTVVAYSAGEQYTFQLIIDVPAHSYSVFVQPDGSAEQLLASEYLFESTQVGVTELTTWGTSASAGSHELCNIAARPATSADCDGDDDVDLADYALMQVCYGQLPVGDCTCIDLDGTGVLDAADQRLFAHQLTGPQAVSTHQAPAP